MTEESTGSPAAAPVPERRCQNCGAVLLGEHCHACGQPTKGLVRHFSSIIGDFLDSVFELDSRILRTLGPLLLKPGFLTNEYFDGRRVRYVSPVRLFVFLSIFAFFAAQWSFDLSEDDGPEVRVGTADEITGPRGRDRILQAATPEEVLAARDQILAELERTRAETVDIPGLSLGLEAAQRAIVAAADERIAELERERRSAAEQRRDEAATAAAEDAGEATGKATGEAADDPAGEATGEREGDAIDEAGAGPAAMDEGVPAPAPAPSPGSEQGPTIQFNAHPWHPVDNPVRISWLPEGINRRINNYVGRAQDNIARIQEDPNLLKDGFLSAVPTTLFILLPLFAVLLKIVYLFKRRLYMEHLIVALHSHSFLCAALLLVLLLDALSSWSAGLPWLSWPLGWLEVLLMAWMPLYLLLMQKRVYRQGWIMTLFKYSLLGTCYLFLVSFGAAFALLLSLVQM